METHKHIALTTEHMCNVLYTKKTQNKPLYIDKLNYLKIKTKCGLLIFLWNVLVKINYSLGDMVE